MGVLNILTNEVCVSFQAFSACLSWVSARHLLLLLLLFLLLTASTITSNLSFAEPSRNDNMNSVRVSNLKEIRGKTVVDQPEVAAQHLSRSALNSTPIVTPVPSYNNLSSSKSRNRQNWQPPTPNSVIDAIETPTYATQFTDIPDPLITLGYTHIEQGNYGTAIRVLQEATVAEPYDSRTQFLIGMAYLLSNSYHSAITSFNRSLKLQEANLNNPATPLSANNNLFGEDIAACTYYGLTIAQTLTNNHAAAYNGTVYLINSYKGEGVSPGSFPPLLSRSQVSSRCFHGLQGQVLGLFPNGGLSSVSTNRVHPLDGNMWLAVLYYFRSLILSNAEYFAEAVEDDRRAVALVPNEVAFQNHLAYNYMESGEYRKAVELYLAIIATYGGSAYRYNSLSMSYTLYGALESSNHPFYQQKAKEASYNACYFYQDCTLYNSITNGDVFVEQLY